MSFLSQKPNLQKKWLEIFNSIIRLKFYTYLENNQSELLSRLDSEFAAFVKTHVGITQDDLRFFGGNTLMGLAYLTLIRMFETLNSELDSDDVDRLFLSANWEAIGLKSFSDLENRYNLRLNVLATSTAKGKKYYDNDLEKIHFFIRKIRNSVSHYRYDHPNNKSIRLIDKNQQNTIELDVVMPYANFMNFCADIGIVLNDAIIK